MSTGNLDKTTAAGIMEIFQELAQEGKCVIAVTHSIDFSESGCGVPAGEVEAGAVLGRVVWKCLFVYSDADFDVMCGILFLFREDCAIL